MVADVYMLCTVDCRLCIGPWSSGELWSLYFSEGCIALGRSIIRPLHFLRATSRTLVPHSQFDYELRAATYVRDLLTTMNHTALAVTGLCAVVLSPEILPRKVYYLRRF